MVLEDHMLRGLTSNHLHQVLKVTQEASNYQHSAALISTLPLILCSARCPLRQGSDLLLRLCRSHCSRSFREDCCRASARLLHRLACLHYRPRQPCRWLVRKLPLSQVSLPSISCKIRTALSWRVGNEDLVWEELRLGDILIKN